MLYTMGLGSENLAPQPYSAVPDCPFYQIASATPVIGPEGYSVGSARDASGGVIVTCQTSLFHAPANLLYPDVSAGSSKAFGVNVAVWAVVVLLSLGMMVGKGK